MEAVARGRTLRSTSGRRSSTTSWNSSGRSCVLHSFLPGVICKSSMLMTAHRTTQMYRPESNRLIRFLELSALTLQLAVNGGSQGKSGYLRVMSMNVSKKQDRPMLAPVKWIQARRPKWWIVRESYLIAVEEPDQVRTSQAPPFCLDIRLI